MRATIAYSLRPFPNETGRELPVKLPLRLRRRGVRVVVSRAPPGNDPSRPSHVVEVSKHVNRRSLRRAQLPPTLAAIADQFQPRFRAELADRHCHVDVDDLDDMEALAQDVISVLSFVTPTRFEIWPRSSEWLLTPETRADEETIVRLGSAFIELKDPSWGYGWSRDSALAKPRAIRRLLDRGVALQLHREAWLLDRPTGIFPALWRVLESAFDASGPKLIKLLVGFQPAVDLAFSDAELQRLWDLRGAQAHADRSRGARDVRETIREVGRQLARLSSLVDAAVLNKKNWGVAAADDLPIVKPTRKRGLRASAAPRAKRRRGEAT